jgi:signal transduction histidine kinase
LHADAGISAALQLLTREERRKPTASHPLSEILRTRAPRVFQPDAAAHLISITNNAAYVEAIRTIDPQAALYLPLLVRGQLIGVLTLFRSSRQFDGDDLAFAEDLGRLVALALDNARLLDAVRASLRAREEMVGVVSHDLRNPVAAVRMLSKVVLGDLESREPGAAEHVALIAQAADQMDALIRDLLDLTRIDARKLAIAAEPVDPSDLLTDCLQILLPLLEAKHISLDMQIEVSLPKVLADPERIQQTLSNLVGNAIKFSPEHGKIVVAASRHGEDYIRISVADNGPGIAPEHLPKVFDRYWQSSRTDRQGAGLGLAIARGIVEAHTGRIWLESTPNTGTTASFTLPIAPPGRASR